MSPWPRAVLWVCVALAGCGVDPRPGDPTALWQTVRQADLDAAAYSPALLFNIGLVGFNRTYSCGEGAGIASGGGCTFDRLHGPEARSCAECHDTPLRDGAGPLSQNVFRFIDSQTGQKLERNPPHLFGAGYVEALAAEMTTELQAQRAQALSQAAAVGVVVVVSLTAKGLDFGQLQARPDGTATYLGTYVQSDLVVRPFQWKGQSPTLRDQNIGALVAHLGLQPVELVGEGQDPDGDGVVDEVTVGQVSALVAYQALLPMPSFVAASSAASVGSQLFRDIGCADCHTPILRLDNPRLTLADPTLAGAGFSLEPDRDGEEPRGLRVAADGPVLVPLFSDLRRHDVGPGLADYRDLPLLPSPLAVAPPLGSPELAALPQIPAAAFLSTRLWGVGSTAPYLHDGRAATLDEAVHSHGGEADLSRQRYAALTAAEQGSVLDFLSSLVLQRGAGLASLPPAAAGMGY